MRQSYFSSARFYRLVKIKFYSWRRVCLKLIAHVGINFEYTHETAQRVLREWSHTYKNFEQQKYKKFAVVISRLDPLFYMAESCTLTVPFIIIRNFRSDITVLLHDSRVRIEGQQRAANRTNNKQFRLKTGTTVSRLGSPVVRKQYPTNPFCGSHRLRLKQCPILPWNHPPGT